MTLYSCQQTLINSVTIKISKHGIFSFNIFFFIRAECAAGPYVIENEHITEDKI